MILRPLCVLIFAMACTLLHAQSNITSPPAINSGGIGVSSSTPTGIQYRRIFFPADQAAKLVPATYWPMELSDLEQRLKQLQANQDGAPSTLEVVEHFVEFDVITNNLKCVSARVKRSTSGATDNAAAATDLKPLYLGQANVAAEFQIPADLPNGNVVWSVPGQGLYAYLRHDDELEFSWTRNGIAQSNRAQLFDLKLPVALRSTMWLLLPEGFTAQVTGGVATDLGGLPSGIVAPTNLKPDVAGKSRWWQIDFGGSANLQLLIRPAPDAAATLTTVVRRAQVKYEVDPNGISWVAQYTIDASDRQPLPAFGVSGTGRITDISIGAESLRWTESRQDDLVIAQPEPSPSLIQRTDSQRSEITLTVSGVDEANAGPELQLPWIRPVRSKVVAVDPQLELQVHTVAGQQLLRGDSSGPWRLNGRSTNGRALQWLGPHEVPPPSVRLEATEEALTGSAITGISIERGRIRAKWVALLDLPSPRPRLLKLRVASTWDVESVTSPHGTVTRPQNEGGRNYTLWIEPSEIDPKQPVRIQVSASKTLDDNLPEVQTRSGWIVQLDDSRLDEAAYLQAPADREVQLPTDGRRRQVTSLEALQLPAVLLAEIPPGALWFAGHGGCPGATLLQRATVFDAELLTKVSFDSIDGYRWESQVACTPAAASSRN